ncbi:MAG: hypothetical protein P4L31_00745 [Candidatus Babeliales bacterium]|nr:hypothetical protein [Candidatus Babeliales bacterium]
MIKRRVARKFQLLFLLSLSPLPCFAAIVLTGDSGATAGQSFSFPVQTHISSPEGNYFYVGAQVGATSNEFAVAMSNGKNSELFPQAPKVTTFNNVVDQQNPLYNGAVQYFGLLSAFGGSPVAPTRIEHPLVVLNGSPQTLYVIDNAFRDNRVESISSLNDSAGTGTATIVGLGNMLDQIAVAAVYPNADANFGGVGSGLAFVGLKTVTVTENDKQINTRTFNQIDALSGTMTSTARALPLYTGSRELMITGNLAGISNVISSHWDEKLGRLFLGLQVTAGAGAADGGRAVVIVAPVQNQGFTLIPIAPDSVFTSGAQNEIIGALDPSALVSANIVRTMSTTTNFNYLIVQGGNGSPSATKRIVSALPLVNKPQVPSTNPNAKPNEVMGNRFHGTIANDLSADLINGTFEQPALIPSQMTHATDDAAMVGGGALVAGDITDMFVRGDAVFVTVFTSDSCQLPGIYSSQALFDETGVIATWTPWQRVGGSTDPVYGATLDSIGDFTTMVGDGVNLSSIKALKRTVWGMGDGDNLLGGPAGLPVQGLISVLGMQLPQSQAGIQGLFDFPSNALGLGNKISLEIVTGLNKIILAQMGRVNNFNVTIPTTGDFATDQLVFDSGVITQTLPGAGLPLVVTISGGALNSVGPIVSAEIGVSTSSNAWICVGGVHGLAVLTNPNGTGWNSVTGLGPNFAGLVSGMLFKTVGNYSFVRKLVADSGFLYVMTDKKLDRIDLSASNFATGNLSVVTLATNASALGLGSRDSFTDLLVSGKFALLANSQGLLRVGNDRNISTASSQDAVMWTQVVLPESVGPVVQLLAVTKAGLPQSFANNDISNLYVLNAYIGKNLGQVARYVVNDVSASDVSDTTIQWIPNYYSAGIPAPIINFNSFKDVIATDGASFLNGVSRDLLRPPFVNILFGLKRSQRSIISDNSNVPLVFGSSSHITQILRSAASGSWLVAGDFGLQVNE